MKKMVINTKNVCRVALSVLLTGVGASTLSSCQDDNENINAAHKVTLEQNEYRENFEALVGKINPNQSWDFSGTSGSETKGGTRAVPTNDEIKPIKVKDPWQTSANTYWNQFWTVDSSIKTWIDNNLKEKENNTGKTLNVPSYFEVPDKPFTIYPVYQGLSLVWDLHIVVEDSNGDQRDYCFWKKSLDMRINDNGTELGAETNNYWDWLEWHGVRQNSKPNDHDYDPQGTNRNNYFVLGISGNPNADETGLKTSTQNAISIQTTGYRFDLSKYKGEKMYFYIKVNGRNYYWANASKDAIQSSLTRQIKYIKPEGLRNFKTMFNAPDNVETQVDGPNGTKKEKYNMTFICVEDADIRGPFYEGNGKKYYLNKDNEKYVEEDYNETFWNPNKWNHQNNNNGDWDTRVSKKYVNGDDVLYNPGNSDYDYNDLVLLMVTENEPTIVYEEEEEVEEREIGKR